MPDLIAAVGSVSSSGRPAPLGLRTKIVGYLAGRRSAGYLGAEFHSGGSINAGTRDHICYPAFVERGTTKNV